MFLCGRQIKKSREVRSFVNEGSKQEEKARQKQRTLHDAVGVSLWKLYYLRIRIRGVGV